MRANEHQSANEWLARRLAIHHRTVPLAHLGELSVAETATWLGVADDDVLGWCESSRISCRPVKHRGGVRTPFLIHHLVVASLEAARPWMSSDPDWRLVLPEDVALTPAPS